jgi:hypothetical protein
MMRPGVFGWILLAGLPLAAQTGGLPPEWETRKMLAELAAQVQRFQPILDQANPRAWVQAGAPETYVAQLQSTRNEVGYLTATAKALAERPDKLSLALEALFRMQAVESFLRSLGEGIRRYQNPALADLLNGLMGETLASRDRLRSYVVDLAAIKEQELAIMDQEAQRCRAQLSRQPAPAPARKSETKGERK